MNLFLFINYLFKCLPFSPEDLKRIYFSADEVRAAESTTPDGNRHICQPEVFDFIDNFAELDVLQWQGS